LQPGETLELVVNIRPSIETDVKWVSFDVDQSALPAGWKIQAKDKNDKTLVLQIYVPKDAKQDAYKLNFTVVPNSGAEEKFSTIVFVTKGLLKSSMTKLKQNVAVNERTAYGLVLNNESIAPEKIIVYSSLGKAWFLPMTYEMQPHQTVEAQVFMDPKVYGNRNFKFYVYSDTTKQLLNEFNAELDVSSNLPAKFAAHQYGMAFFTISLLPYEVLSSFLSAVYR
jgi:hypothetical protein